LEEEVGLLLLLLQVLLWLVLVKEGVLHLVDVGVLRLKVWRRGGKGFVVPGHQQQGRQGRASDTQREIIVVLRRVS
jgi:hypothetical protein